MPETRTRRGPQEHGHRLYNFSQAAEYLGLNINTLARYARAGKIAAMEHGSTYVFMESVLFQYRKKQEERKRAYVSLTSDPVRFGEKYGKGSYERLIQFFSNANVNYSEVARAFGISRERVRQWHDTMLPDEAGIRNRKRIVRLMQHRRKLQDTEPFKTFYRAARRHFSRESIRPVPCSRVADSGFRKNFAKLRGRTVSVRKTSGFFYEKISRTYMLFPLIARRGDAEFIFYSLGADDFLFVPVSQLPEYTTFIDSEGSKYHKFKNNFGALRNKSP